MSDPHYTTNDPYLATVLAAESVATTDTGIELESVTSGGSCAVATGCLAWLARLVRAVAMEIPARS